MGLLIGAGTEHTEQDKDKEAPATQTLHTGDGRTERSNKKVVDAITFQMMNVISDW
jgi:hypothetical protein